ncbi:MAG: patatin-like phospholipase family protein [Bacilli bacterium]|nr:patatin-like phospholipase family protein [Bacilli bacterium]
MRAIVLSGGGAKGAYELGVWKALKELNITYDIVTGTSVGALNGAFMVQNDYLKALSMWQNINFDMVFQTDFSGNLNTFDGIKELIAIYGKGILNGGMDVHNLEKTIDRYINLDKFYQSNIEYGLVTVNLSNLTSITLTKREIPRDKLKDYLMASATCFPAFKTKKINGDNYIDGGYYDNMPIDLAVSMGATEVIAVDIGGKGIFPKKKKHYSIPVTYIKPRNDIGSFLVFDKNLAIRNIALGFNDTMKVYEKYEGTLFTFYKTELDRIIDHHSKQIKKELRNILQGFDRDRITMKDLFQLKQYQELLNDQNKYTKLMKEVVELLGISLEIDITKVYKRSSYEAAIKNYYKKIPTINMKEVRHKIMNKKYSDLFHSKIVIKYIYQLFTQYYQSDFVLLMLLFKKEFMAALYLKVLLG